MLFISIIFTWLKRLLGIKSPTEEFYRLYAPEIKAEMELYMAYTERVIELLKNEGDTGI